MRNLRIALMIIIVALSASTLVTSTTDAATVLLRGGSISVNDRDWVPNVHLRDRVMPVDSIQNLTQLMETGGEIDTLSFASETILATLQQFRITTITRIEKPSIRGPLGELDLSFLDRWFRVDVPDSAVPDFIDSVRARDGFYAERAPSHAAFEDVPNDPGWGTQTYLHGDAGPPHLGMPGTWDITLGDTTIILGILDSGVRRQHAELAGITILGDNGYSVAHGQGVTGIIAAQTNNSFGGAGIVRTPRLSMRRVDCTGCIEPDWDIRDQFLQVLADGAWAVNCSWYIPDPNNTRLDGTPAPATSVLVREAMAAAANAGVTINCAGGNYAEDVIHEPADYAFTLAWGALKSDGRFLQGVNTGPHINFGAQAENILTLSTANDSALVSDFGGSSASAAQGTGLTGLILASGLANGDTLSWDDVKGIMGLYAPSKSAAEVPRIDSSLKLVNRPGDLVRFKTLPGRQWEERTQELQLVMSGMNGAPSGLYVAIMHACSTYVPYTEMGDFYVVHGSWPDGPRSNSGMDPDRVTVPAHMAWIPSSDAGGVWLGAVYYTNIRSLTGSNYGSWPVGSAGELEVAMAVAAEKRLPVIPCDAWQDDDVIRVETIHPATDNELRLVADVKVGQTAWNTGFAVVPFDAPSRFDYTGLQGSQTYQFRWHAETELQSGATAPPPGNVTLVRTPPNEPTNLAVSVIRQGTPKVLAGGGKNAANVGTLIAAVPGSGLSNRLRVSADPPLNQAEEVNGYLVVTHHYGDSHLVCYGAICETAPDVQYDTVWGAGSYSTEVCVPLNNALYEVWTSAFDSLKMSEKGASMFVTTGDSWNLDCGHLMDWRDAPEASKEAHNPPRFGLLPNVPNPFNAATTIRFTLAEDAETSLEVFNILGQQVTTLVEGVLPAGEHIVDWNAAGIASGMYLYRLTSGPNVATRKMVVLK